MSGRETVKEDRDRKIDMASVHVRAGIGKCNEVYLIQHLPVRNIFVGMVTM